MVHTFSPSKCLKSCCLVVMTLCTQSILYHKSTGTETMDLVHPLSPAISHHSKVDCSTTCTCSVRPPSKIISQLSTYLLQVNNNFLSAGNANKEINVSLCVMLC